MTPSTRKTAIAAAATLIPAALAAAAATAYPDRTRRLGNSISGRLQSSVFDRLQDVVEDAPADIEKRTRHIMRRLDDLAHQIDRNHYVVPERTSHSPLAIISGGIAAALVIPTVLTAIFAPHKLREARDAVTGLFETQEEEDAFRSELSRVSERLDTLNSDLEKQRSSNYDDIVRAAHHDD